MQNPFFNIGEFPDFPKMTPEAADEALPKLLADARARVDELEKTAEPTWEGLVRALDDAQHPLYQAWGIVSHMQSVCNSDAWRKIEEKYQGDLVAFSLRVGQSKRFYELTKQLRERLGSKAGRDGAPSPSAGGGVPSLSLGAPRLRILDKMIQGADLAGVALEGDRQ